MNMRMQPLRASRSRRGPLYARRAALFVAVGVLVTPWSAAHAAAPALATASAYSVLAGTTVTNTGPSVLSNNAGVSPGSAVTGFPPGLVLTTVIDRANPVALQAQADLTAAYIDAAGRPITATEPTDLSDLRLAPGVYDGTGHGPLALTGPLVLDGGGDYGAVFIFQAGSTLTTASGSTVSLINGATTTTVAAGRHSHDSGRDGYHSGRDGDDSRVLDGNHHGDRIRGRAEYPQASASQHR